MKAKWIGGIAMLLALSIAFVTSALGTEKQPRVHQHLQEAKAACTIEHQQGELCTQLPVVVLDTGGTEIPGQPIHSDVDEDGRILTTYTMAEDGDSRIRAKMRVIDGEGCNHLKDACALETDITIRVRGRSSRYFAKKSYALSFVNPDGSNNNQSVMGMDAHHDWVLYGPYLDKTDLRNYMFYNISGEIMDYAPNVRYCEVILNGEYQGLYLLEESITAGENGARLNLSVKKRSQAYTGYIIRLDQNHLEEEIIGSFTGYTFRRSAATDMEIVYPKGDHLTVEMKESISKDFSDFEKMLYSYDYDNGQDGYRAYIDVESFVDAFLINEITANYDFGSLSTYIYKDTDNRFRICLWDFNNCCDNFADAELGWRSIELDGAVWYAMLLKDEDFTNQVIDRYRVLRTTYFSDEYLNTYMDQTVAYLGDAVARDRLRWEDTYETGQGLLTNTEGYDRNTYTYAAAIEQLKNYLQHRLEWLDENIETLRQYSAESKVKGFTETAN